MPSFTNTTAAVRPARIASDATSEDEHEQVVLCRDRRSGLSAVIAIHSTALGPALGGTRFHPYLTEADAMRDALNLSRAMSYKNAMAGVGLGGGKAVIIGNPASVADGGAKSRALLHAYGRFVQSLGGRYITACDVGTYVADMDVVAEECDYTLGRSTEHGGAGDSSILTAFGVLQGIRACAQFRWGSPELHGRRVGVAGVGKVGRRLVRHLLDEGANVVATDIRQDLMTELRDEFPDVEFVADTDTLIRATLDVYAPCALGGALDDQTVPTLSASVVCGAANNQLAHPGIETRLAERDVLYAPDYVVNAGGVIQVAEEFNGYRHERATERARSIFTTTLELLNAAAAEEITPSTAAGRIARQRMAGGIHHDRLLIPGGNAALTPGRRDRELA